MAFDAFLKIDGIPGESTDDKHKDWIEVLSFSHGVSQRASGSASTAGGATAERADFADFSIVKALDKASPKIFEASATGKHLKAVTVELFGRPFRASAAAAELARASGCAVLGVTVVRQHNGYAAKILPEFQYDRQALGNREARRQFIQRILSAFEPEIRQHADQWFHFVPVWKVDGPSLVITGSAP